MRLAWMALGLAPWLVGAREPLSLAQAVEAALARNLSLKASSLAVKAAETRVAAAQSGHLPKVDYAESWTNSNNPVYVFGSLLTQRQFGAANFAIDSLNRPGFLNNFQSQINASQTIFDAGATKRAVHSAELGTAAAREDSRRTEMEVIAAVSRAYYDVLATEEQVTVAEQAMRSAQADLERAHAIREAGLSTDADVLSIRVHLAGVQEQKIRRDADLDVARATLNDAMGLPLDMPHSLTTALKPIDLASTLTERETTAVAERPEAKQAALATQLAETQLRNSRSSLLPQVSARAGFEADRQRFVTRAGSNWLVAIGLRWNLFNGFGDRARIDESRYQLQRSEAEKDRLDSAIRLQVRRAWADLRAAGERISAAAASVNQAEESLRITKNRYEAGLANVTDLLRTESMSMEAQARRLIALRDQRVAAVQLEFAAGTLSAKSELWKEESK